MQGARIGQVDGAEAAGEADRQRSEEQRNEAREKEGEKRVQRVRRLLHAAATSPLSLDRVTVKPEREGHQPPELAAQVFRAGAVAVQQRRHGLRVEAALALDGSGR